MERDAALEQVTRLTTLFKPASLSPNQFPIVYDHEYNISFMGMEKLHAFDSGKWGKVFGFIKDAGVLNDYNDVVHPEEATKSDLLVVHTKSYLKSLKCSAKVAQVVEVPPVAFVPNPIVQCVLLSPLRRQTGGTILAAKLALTYGWAINLGGGFHHCSSDRGGGFCAYADITLAIRFLQLRGEIRTAMIVDLDAHQGNGHERDFLGNDSVYILDAFNPSIYPHDTHAMAAIRQRVPLRAHINDADYLAAVNAGLQRAFSEFTPDLVVYNAGTDTLAGDPLGMLDVSPQGIIQRDQLVFENAQRRSIPVVMVLSGGYQTVSARVIADSIINLSNRGMLARVRREDSSKISNAKRSHEL